MRYRPFAGRDMLRAALSSKRRRAQMRERREKTTPLQQIGLESSDVSYIVAHAEIEGGLKISLRACRVF
jgi:hypothetical protein